MVIKLLTPEYAAFHNNASVSLLPRWCLLTEFTTQQLVEGDQTSQKHLTWFRLTSHSKACCFSCKSQSERQERAEEGYREEGKRKGCSGRRRRKKGKREEIKGGHLPQAARSSSTYLMKHREKKKIINDLVLLNI